MPHHHPAAAGHVSRSATGGRAQSLRCLQPPALCCWSHVGAHWQPAGTLAQAAAAAACTPALQQQGMLLLLPLVVVARASQAAVGCLQCHCLVAPGQQQQEPQQGPKTGWLAAPQG